MWSITFLAQDTKMLAKWCCPSACPPCRPYHGKGDRLPTVSSNSLKPSSFHYFLYCVASQIQGKAPHLSGVEFFEMEVAVCEEEEEARRKLVRIWKSIVSTVGRNGGKGLELLDARIKSCWRFRSQLCQFPILLEVNWAFWASVSSSIKRGQNQDLIYLLGVRI